MKIINWKIIFKRFIRRIKYAFYFNYIVWEYESCIICGHCYKYIWYVPDEIWQDVIGSDIGCLCIDCFVDLANKKGIVLNNSDIEMELFNP